jgi:hypothetical protein
MTCFSFDASMKIHFRSPVRSSPDPVLPPGSGIPLDFSDGFAQIVTDSLHASDGDGIEHYPGFIFRTTSLMRPRVALATTSLAHPAHESTTREERGRRLFEEHGDEIRFEDGVWLVPSQSEGTSVYEVTLGLRASCECKDFEFNGRKGEPCKHIRCARLAQAAALEADPLRIDFPLEEELLAACEYALRWFEQWEEHADHEHDFGGEHSVMKHLRRAIRFAREEA